MNGIGLVPLEGGTFGPLAPEHWSEVIVGLLLAAFLAFLVQKLVVPRFESLYAERSNQIEGGIRRSEQAQLEAQQAKDEYQALMSRARDDASALRDQARQQGAAIVEEARAKSQAESQRMLDQARTQIEAERSAASDQLRAEVGGLATTLAGRIVGESLDDSAAASRAVDRFLAELAEQPAKADQGQQA